MNSTVCFSADSIDALNHKAQIVDPRLYLFAYYEPKTIKLEDSPRIHFITAIVNLYGLLWDCGPFVHKNLLWYNKARPLCNILPDDVSHDKRKIAYRCRDFANVISSFRSIFCHNNSSELTLDRESLDVVDSWTLKHCCISHPYEELAQEDWSVMLETLISEATSMVHDIDDCLDQLIVCRGSERFRVAYEYWIQSIAQYYITNPEILLGAMADFYLLYLNNLHEWRNYKVPLRNLTITWLAESFGVERKNWSKRWLDVDDGLENSKVYQLINNWQNSCGERDKNGQCEAVMPASSFFLVLADDVYRFAQNPGL